MSTIASDVQDRSPYAAPEADVRIKSELIEDKFFGAQGRIGVMRYNARVFQSLLMMLAGGGVMAAAYFSDNTTVMLITTVPCIIAMVAGLVVMIYSAIKRLHDINLSGWYYLVGMIPIVGAVFHLYYALKPGKQDDNKFGAFRESTNGDKVMGVIGLLLTVLITIGAMIPQSYFA